ncbi:MAG: type II toxin-antitoxin system VapC family toxin [Gemmataceae bacterium]
MIYIDANVIIRLIEGDSTTRLPLENHLLPYRGCGRFLMTSRLSRLECLVKPVRFNDDKLISLYETFFASAELLLIDVTAEVIEIATKLRANLNLKTPDALHLASAVHFGAKEYLTGDKSLSKCEEISVEVI